MSYPNPILNLDFVNAKQLGDKVAFSRSSPATFWDRNDVLRTAVDNMPRFDHDPLTGICKGLLVEPQVAFLETYSEQFDNAAWAVWKMSIAANATTSPDSTITASKLIESDDTDTHALYRSVTITAGGTYTVSLFVKSGERSKVLLGLRNGTETNKLRGLFDLSSGLCSTAFGGASTGTVKQEYIGNGWYKCSVTGVVDSTSTSAVIDVLIYNTASGYYYDGDGASGVYIWGAKLYAGTGPTSYLPSVASPVTRAADLASVDLTQLKGYAGEPLWNGNEGTVVVDHEAAFVSGLQHIFSLTNGINYDEYILMRYTAARAVEAAVDSITSSPLSGVFSTSGDRAKSIIAFDRNGLSALCTGGNVFSSAYVPPILTNLYLGSLTGAYVLNGHIRSVQLYNTRIDASHFPSLVEL